jgi:hypothetical protein
VIIPFRFFLGKQGICGHKPHFCHRHPETGSSLASNALVSTNAKNREFPLGRKSRFLLVGGTAPIPLEPHFAMLATRLRRWFVEYGARFARSVLVNSATLMGDLDPTILRCETLQCGED